MYRVELPPLLQCERRIWTICVGNKTKLFELIGLPLASRPSSAASSSATRGAAAMAASASRNRARVRRASTSSTVRAISWRAAKIAWPATYGKRSASWSPAPGDRRNQLLQCRRVGAVFAESSNSLVARMTVNAAAIWSDMVAASDRRRERPGRRSLRPSCGMSSICRPAPK